MFTIVSETVGEIQTCFSEECANIFVLKMSKCYVYLGSFVVYYINHFPSF